MSLRSLTFFSFGGALMSFGVAATFAGASGYPRNVLGLYENAAYPREATIEKGTVPFGVRSELNVVTSEADVVLELVEGATIEAMIEGELTKTDDGRHLDLEFSDRSVTIRVRERPLTLLKFPVLLSMSKAPRLTIRIPKDFSGILRVETASGAVSLRGGSLAELSVSTSSGAISIAEADAHVLRLDSRSGAITLSAVVQDAIAETLSGAITASVRTAFGISNASFVFRSKSGAIKIGVAPDASLAVLLESASGSVVSRLALGGRATTTATQVSGDLGEGRGSLFVRTGSGPIVLESLAP